MKLCDGIHQIRIDFQVTPQVMRYVYVYLIESEHCYLIDSGVAGSEQMISQYMKNIGRDLSEIKGVFLTHAHPDHIGGAAKLKALTGCRIYASKGERRWIEDIDLEYRERPIPNFYQLTGTSSVQVDTVLADGDIVRLEPYLQIEAVSTGGHSYDDYSYLLRDKGVLFTGDAIPVADDIPIYIDSKRSMKSLERLCKLSNTAQIYCPAWDKVYRGRECRQSIVQGITLMQTLERNIIFLLQENTNATIEQYTALLCEKMKMPQLLNNPLFQRTVLSHIYSLKKEG